MSWPQTYFSLWKGVRPYRSSMKAIAQAVADEHGLSLEELLGYRRRRREAIPRHQAMADIYATERYSMPQIGRFFGGRDHTTILYGIRTHRARIAAL